MKKSKIFVILLLTILGISCIAGGIYFKDYSKTPIKKIYDDIPYPVVKENKLSLIMVGDALIHGAVYADAKTGANKYNFLPMFTEVRDVFKGYDLAFYNQETVLGGSEIGISTYPRFNSPYEVGDAFLDMGFNLVSLATNHTLDRF